jgi:plasmid stabilization system protein ParE
MGSYRLARRAESDLEDIWDYTESTWSAEQAEKFLDGLFSCFQAIADGRAKAKPIDAVRIGSSPGLSFQQVLTEKVPDAYLTDAEAIELFQIK